MILYPLSCKAYIRSISEYPDRASARSLTFTLSLLLLHVLQIFILRIPFFALKALKCSSDFSIPHILHFFIICLHSAF